MEMDGPNSNCVSLEFANMNLHWDFLELSAQQVTNFKFDPKVDKTPNSIMADSSRLSTIGILWSIDSWFVCHLKIQTIQMNQRSKVQKQLLNG